MSDIHIQLTKATSVFIRFIFAYHVPGLAVLILDKNDFLANSFQNRRLKVNFPFSHVN